MAETYTHTSFLSALRQGEAGGMIRFMLSRTGKSSTSLTALALLLAACSGSGGTTKTPEEDEEDDGNGAPGAGGTPKPDPKNDDDNPDPGPTTIDQKPTGLELTPNTATVEENSNPRILATVTLTDADGGKNILTLTGTDSGLFEIRNNNQLWLTGSLDFETDQSHSVIVTVNTNSGLQERFTLTVGNINDSPPKITSPDTGTALPEEISVAIDKVIYTAIGTPDVSTHKITWTIGGTDGNLFTIDGDTGEVTFKSVTTPDFEDKESYSFIVTATVGAQSASKTVTINVTNIDEALVIAREDGTAVGTALTVGSPENQQAVIDLKATPTISGRAITWSLEGADKDLFQIDGEGVITWREAPDYEATLSNAGSQAFSLIAIASDGAATDSVNITVNLENVDEAGRVADFSTTPVVGEKLFPPQITDPDSPGGVVIIRNQWQVRENGNWVEKSTDDGYTPTPADVGKQIQLVVTYRDYFGDKTLTTNPSAAVIEATQSLFTNVQNASPYLAEAISYAAGHKLASFDLTSGAEMPSVAISLQDEAGLVRLQKAGSRYEIVLSKEKEFDFETEVRSGNYNYDFTVRLTKTDGQTQDIGFSIPFKNGFGPSDKGADDTTPQKFYTNNGLWYPLAPTDIQQTTFDAREQAVLERMTLEGGYDPSFLFYWGNMARDEVFGTVNNDILYGNGGNDALSGGAGNDHLSGDSGNDFLSGQLGNDILVGGAGEDELYGGRGKNTLTGGRDADKFTLVKADSSTDTITDFNRSEGDKILYDHTTNSAANLAAIGLRKEINSDSNLQLVDAGNDHIYMIFDGLSQLSDITIADFELI